MSDHVICASVSTVTVYLLIQRDHFSTEGEIHGFNTRTNCLSPALMSCYNYKHRGACLFVSVLSTMCKQLTAVKDLSFLAQSAVLPAFTNR
jgi:hypothetical protein